MHRALSLAGSQQIQGARHRAQRPRPIAGGPIRKGNGGRAAALPRRDGVGPAVADKQGAIRRGAGTTRPAARLGHSAGLHCGNGAAVMVQHPHVAVQLIHTVQHAVPGIQHLARAAAGGLGQSLYAAGGQIIFQRKAVQAAVAQIRQE